MKDGPSFRTSTFSHNFKTTITHAHPGSRTHAHTLRQKKRKMQQTTATIEANKRHKIEQQRSRKFRRIHALGHTHSLSTQPTKHTSTHACTPTHTPPHPHTDGKDDNINTATEAHDLLFRNSSHDFLVNNNSLPPLSCPSLRAAVSTSSSPCAHSLTHTHAHTHTNSHSLTHSRPQPTHELSASQHTAVASLTHSSHPVDLK